MNKKQSSGSAQPVGLRQQVNKVDHVSHGKPLVRKSISARALYTIPEAGHVLSLGRTMIYGLSVPGGPLQRIKIGRCARITASSVAAFLSHLKFKAANEIGTVTPTDAIYPHGVVSSVSLTNEEGENQ